MQKKQSVKVRATREVLLCGGAVNTPQVLQLSGIGDAETLKRFDIPVVQELKGVGRNLQDHLDASIQYECSQPITLYSQANPLNAMKTGLQYMLFGTGLATGQGLESGAFLKSRPDLETPDLQFHFIAALMTDHTRVKADRHGFMAHVCQLRPQSRGYITLKSADPLARAHHPAQLSRSRGRPPRHARGREAGARGVRAGSLRSVSRARN